MARRYRFRLDSVLRVRRIQEEMARKELVEAVRDQTTAQEKLVRRSEHYAGLPPAPSDLATRRR